MKRVLFIITLLIYCNALFSQNVSVREASLHLESEGFLGYLNPSSIDLNDPFIRTEIPDGKRCVEVQAPPFFTLYNCSSEITMQVQVRRLLIWNDGYEGQSVEFPIKVLTELPTIKYPYGKFYVWKVYWQS